VQVTLFSVTGPSKGQEAHQKWQVMTAAMWSNKLAPAGIAPEKIVPTLETISLSKFRQPEAILVAGEAEAVVLSPSGSQLTMISLPFPPVAPMVIGDFSGDGLTDLILVTSNTIYGFVQTRQPGAILFSMLIGALLVVMAVIFITQHFGTPKGKPRHPDSI
jgi:hypothetical protein